MELAGSGPGAVGEEEREGKDDCVGPARCHSPYLRGIFRREALLFVGLSSGLGWLGHADLSHDQC